MFLQAQYFQKKLNEATIIAVHQEDIGTIKRKLVSAYLAGYNSIQIKADKQQPFSSRQRHELKSFVRHMLVGTEIVNDTSSQLILQVLLRYPELSIQSALRRMTIITISMHKDAISGFVKNDKEVLDNVESIDNEVDRFNLYVTRLLKTAIYNPRIIKEIGLDNANDCLGYRILIKYIERTADHAVSIAKNAAILKNEVNSNTVKKIEKMSSVAIMMFEGAMESLFTQDYNAAERIIQNVQEIERLEKDAIASFQLDIADGPNLRLIIESVKRTAEYACDLAEIVLNLTVDSILV